MTFVDTSVFVYAVGRAHPLRAEARALLADAVDAGEPLVTSAEVLQELLHVYLPVARTRELERAWSLAERVTIEIWPIERDDVELARSLTARHPDLFARDLVHLASCMRRGVERAFTFDGALGAAIGG